MVAASLGKMPATLAALDLAIQAFQWRCAAWRDASLERRAKRKNQGIPKGAII
jgi:hypothetical protein